MSSKRKPPAVAKAALTFRTAAEFRRWLGRHHRTATEIVVRIYRVHALDLGVGYAEALDVALCHGWIDAVRGKADADSYTIRFTPRKPRSIWSKVNVAHAERLVREGKMMPAGLAAFAARTEERTGIYSFERPPVELAADFAQRLRANRKAWKYFQAEAPSYRRLATHWVMSARQQATRERRLEILIDSCARGLRIPSQRER